MLIEVRPGEGGEDARQFANELAGAISAFARRRGDESEREGAPDGRSIVLHVAGPPKPYAFLTGTHRVQRVPRNDTRRHTSTATVAVLDEGDATSVVVRPEDCRVQPYRASGPGGQHRNKSWTAVRVTHLPSGIIVEAAEERSREQNLRAALRRIESALQRANAEADEQRVRAERVRQVASPERPAKSWTHDAFRGVVRCHETGERIAWSDFQRGRMGARVA